MRLNAAYTMEVRLICDYVTKLKPLKTKKAPGYPELSQIIFS
jgi:hypothetical protein